MILRWMRDIWVIYWTCVQCVGRLGLSMRRKLRIRASFEPNRLGTEYLHQAYELVVPVSSRQFSITNLDEVSAERVPSDSKKREKERAS